jgi:hypothetical protein
MIRRAYKITPDQDAEISSLSRDGSVDKEQIVQAALQFGLPEVRQRWEAAGRPKGLEFFRAVLIGGAEGRISEPSAKRRRSR